MRNYALCLVLLAVACSDDDPALRLNVDDKTVTTMEDTPISAMIDIDANRAVQAEMTSAPTHGTVTTHGNGSGTVYTYTPAADYVGADEIGVTVTLGDKTASATLHINVTPVDDAPLAQPDSFAANFDTPLTIQASALLMNDTDKDSTTLTVTGVQSGPHGTVALEGTTITFTPETAYQGNANFNYTLSDGEQTATGEVTVAVGNNTPPVAANDSATTAEDTALTIPAATLLANDTDAEHQTLSLISASGAEHGTVALVGTSAVFTPEANYFGAASFKYTIADGAGTSEATVAVTVTPVNDAPLAGADTLSTTEDTNLVVQAAALLQNDTDVDGDTLTVASVTSGAGGTVTLAAGQITFVPTADFHGSAAFTYTVSDGMLSAVGTVAIDVASVNDAPVAVADLVTGLEDTVSMIPAAQLLMNDQDADGDTLSVIAVTNPTHGAVSLVNGNAVFVPAPNFAGPATFDYTITDGILTSSTTVTVAVTAVNDLPVVVDDNVTTPEDIAVAINVIANDSDVETALTIASVTQPAHGSVTASAGTATYTPVANYFGADTFTYTASDGQGGTATATVHVTVTSVNDAPVAANDMFVINEDETKLLDVRANDSDVDGDTLTIASVTLPQDGTATVQSGQIRFVPHANFFGNVTFQYTLSDGHGAQATASVVVTVVPQPDPAVAIDDHYTMSSESDLSVPASIGVLANDQFIDGGETVAISEYPYQGDLTLNPDGSFVYSPYDDCVQEDSFSYYVVDPLGNSNIATVYINVNHAPFAEYDFYSTNVDEPVTVTAPGVLGNDFDADGDTLTASLVSGPDSGASLTFHPDGSFTLTPASGFTGEITFTYQVTDGIATDQNDVYVDVNDEQPPEEPLPQQPAGPSPQLSSPAPLHGHLSKRLSRADEVDQIEAFNYCCITELLQDPSVQAGGPKGCYNDAVAPQSWEFSNLTRTK
jgi:hypothetical protein